MRLLSSADAASLLAVQPSTLRSWVRRGWLTNHGDSRRALYDVAELTKLAVIAAA